MNWVDLLAILPYFVSLVLAEVITETSARGSEDVNRVGKFLKLLKVFVFRVMGERLIWISIGKSSGCKNFMNLSERDKNT